MVKQSVLAQRAHRHVDHPVAQLRRALLDPGHGLGQPELGVNVVDAGPHRIERGLPGPHLAGQVRAGGQRGELVGGLQGAGQHLVVQDDLVHPAGRERGFAEERLGQTHRLLEGRRGEPKLHHLEGGVGQHHADRHLVGLKGVVVRGNSVIEAARQEGAHRDRVTGDGGDDRLGERQQSVGEVEAGLQHGDRGVDVAGAEHLEVEAAAEHPVVAGDDHRAGILAFGAVQGVVDLLQHARTQDVDLAVVECDHGDRVVLAIADRPAHGCSFVAASTFVPTLRNEVPIAKR